MTTDRPAPLLHRGGLPRARFGVGLAALGRPAYMTLGHAEDFPAGRDVAAMEANAHRVLDRAFAAGVRIFDAARSYGRAEEFLRSWLDARGVGPREVFVSSKWGYRYTGDWKVDGRVQEVKEHTAELLESQAAESTALLGPFLSLYQIHSATPGTGVLENPRVLSGLARLRERGLGLGVTVTGASQAETVRRALAVRVDGAPLFSAVQATWNLLERSAGDALREAHAAGLAVIVKEPLANGRLTPRGAEGRAGPLRALADRLAAGPDAVALAAAAAQPWADVVLLGAANEAQLASNLGAAGLSLDEAALASLDELRASPAGYWAERSRLPWT